MSLRNIAIILLSLFIIFNYPTSAQTPSFLIKGKVIDSSDNKPLEFATISLKKVRDSSLVGGTISNVNGEFSIPDLPPGGYNLEIAFIGYEKINQKVFLRPKESPAITDLGVIKLNISAKMLEGAEITAEKSFMINNIDKKTYNTDQLSVAAGGNVKDVMENIPSVEVDGDGNVSLRGNANVTILIDGRPSGLTGEGGKSLLESIPASAIENIEVITNPSAKYDPDGISGIINIVTKKNKLQGFTGNVGANTTFENRYGGNLSLAYRKGKWNTYANYGYIKDNRKFYGDSYTETYFGDDVIYLTQDEESESPRQNHNLKAGIDFNLNDNNTVSASALYNTGNNDETGNIDYITYDEFMTQDSLVKRINTSEGSNQNLDFDFNWKHNFKQKGRAINFLGTASFDNSEDLGNYNQQGYIDDVTPVSTPPVLQKDAQKDDNEIYTASADYEHPISKDKKIEAGYKGTFRNFDSDYNYEYYNDTTGVYVNDVNRTNRFIYSDQLHAMYAQYRQSIKKFGYQLGVRSEYATTQSELVTTDENFTKDYYSIFPSGYVTYELNEKSQLKATYSKRINRPRRNALNPFSNYEDPLNIRKGNPNLDPEYTNSFELEYSRFIGKLSLTTTGYARLTTDYIQRYREVSPEGITTTTFENLSSAKNYGLEIILNGSPYKWWTFTLSSNMFYNEVDGSNLEDDLNSSAMNISGRIFTTFKLPYKSDFQISYSYRAPSKVTQGTMKEMQTLTLALSKKLFKDKGVASIRVADPFDKQSFGFEFESDDYYQEFNRKRQSRIVTLSFTYRFGELKDRDQRQRRDNGTREEMDFEG